MDYKNYIKKLLGKVGYKINKIKYEVEEYENPIQAEYIESCNFIMEVNINSLRGMHGFVMDRDGPHPFVQTAVDFLKEGKKDFKNTPLYNFYKQFQPNSAGDLLQLSNEEFSRISPIKTVQPWLRETFNQRYERWKSLVKNENLSRSGIELDITHGVSGFGPVSDEKCIIEYESIISLCESIKNNGFKNNITNPITAYTLNYEGDFKYVISDGQHRVAVLIALGYNKIPILLSDKKTKRIISRRESQYFPNVVNSIFTIEEAQHVFDLYFNGRKTI